MPKKQKKGKSPPAALPVARDQTFTLRSALLPAACLILAGGAAYWNSFRGAFLFDDLRTIVENFSLRHLWPPWDCLFASQNISRPVVAGTLAANYALGELKPWGYHALNLAIHILAALTLFGIVRRTLASRRLRERFSEMATPLAFLAALLWLVHPLQTESVTYVIQRAESLMGLFYLLTLYCVIRGADTARPAGWHILAVLCCFLGAGCKQVMVTAPLVVLLYDRIFISENFAAVLTRWKLYAGLAASWILLALLTVMSPASSTAGFDMQIFTPAEYAWSQPGVILHYLRLCLWPDTLCLDYCWPVAGTAAEILPGVLALGALLAATCWALVRAPAWGFVGAWFFLILAPTSSIMPIADLAFEHRMYLSLAAVTVCAVCGAYSLGRALLHRFCADGPRAERLGRGLAAAVSGVALAGLICRTNQRNEDYKSEYRMWSCTARQRPANVRVLGNFGKVLLEKGRDDEAMARFEQAVQAAPNYADAHNNLGFALICKNRLDEAVAQCREALKLNPQHFRAHFNLGLALFRQDKLDESVAEYKEALKLSPEFADAHSGLAEALSGQGKTEEAIAQCREALRLKPDSPEAHVSFGLALVQQGRPDEAAAHYQEALKLKPDYSGAYNNWGMLLAQQGKRDEAMARYQDALRLKPDSSEAHNNLGKALAEQGKLAEAITQFEEALRLKPDYAEAHSNCANALGDLGQVDEAIAHYQMALKIRPQYPSAHNNFGATLLQVGRVPEAIEHFQEALRMKPDFPLAKETLARALGNATPSGK